ncbi:hypothetical protein HHI36_002384 [Cryptolaemus montrouzieri]|uniref:Uncharacterized protein n=1 Tax=Cryptolaemus montrouzieri TaxID=559131 RepID=A0ABD2PAA9_9CUCU
MTETLEYVPHKLRSHPFQCLVLPWILVFLVIFYWFSLVPILFTHYIEVYKPTVFEKYVFLGVHFVIFVIILAVLVCLWRINPVKNKINTNGFYTIVSLDKSLNTEDDIHDKFQHSLEESSICMNKKSYVSSNQDSNVSDSENFDDVNFRECAFHEEERPISQNVEVALTPRELFFRDLYENASKSLSSITQKFIQRERENSSRDLENLPRCISTLPQEQLRTRLPKSDQTHNDANNSNNFSTFGIRKKQDKDISEFFIANIPQRKSVTSEFTIYIAEPDESQIIRNINFMNNQ